MDLKIESNFSSEIDDTETIENGGDNQISKDLKMEWREKEAAVSEFEPSGDIFEDARNFWELIGVNYKGSHMEGFLKNKDLGGLIDQLKYTSGVGERSRTEEFNSLLEAEQKIIGKILDAHERNEEEKEKFDVNLISPENWKQYKALKLDALKNDPQAFGASYEENLARTDDDWKDLVSKFHKADSKFSVHKMFSVEENGEFVGMGGFFRSSPKTARISEVYTKKESRGNGIGSALLKNILNEIEKDGRFDGAELIVNKEQRDAIDLYERFGFIVEGPAMIDGKESDEKYLMIKKISEVSE